ncbi:MAG: response regulator [Candidatus Binatia bacterium]
MPTILIAEDNNLTRTTLAQFLRTEGYEVESAENGAQAVLLLNEKKFDLVISDVVMPHLNGFGLLHRVNSLSPGTPVLLMTAYAPMQPRRAETDGAAELMLKPIQLSELLSKVRRLLERKQSE